MNYNHRKPRRRPRGWNVPDMIWLNYQQDLQANTNAHFTGSATQPLRSLNMNTYPSQQQQPSRQAPRLQNVNKSGLGNGAGAGWGGFGLPGSSGGGAFGGLGGAGAPGLGQNQGQPRLSGFAQVMGGGSGQGPIDMSDFPSLASGPRSQQNHSNAAGWNSNAIRQPSSQQPPPLGQQPQQRAPSVAPSQQSLDQFDTQRSQPPTGTDRAGSGDDFPPLGGQINGDAFGQSNGISSAVGSPDIQQPRMNGQQSQLPVREGNGQFPQNQALLSNQYSSQTQPPPSQNGQQPPPSNVKRYADMTENEKWGLPGLNAAFEARRAAESGGLVDETLPPMMRSSVIMGHDLSTLGMDLDSSEPLHPTFTPFPAAGSSGSEFNFHERHMVPDFTLPSAYTVTNVPPLSSRMSAFADETLFSIFYQHPRDVLQELAAHELMTREWRWHKVLRQWLQKDSPTASSTNPSSSALPLRDLTNGHPIGTPPVRLGDRGEKGVYVFFDAMNWRRERRWLELDYEHLDPMRVPSVVNGVGGPVMPVQRRLDGVGAMGEGSSSIPGA